MRQRGSDRIRFIQFHIWDGSFSRRTDRAQAIGVLAEFVLLLIYKEEKTAFDLHCFDDDANCYGCKALHIKDVADALAIFMQGTTGIILINIKPAMHHLAHK